MVKTCRECGITSDKAKFKSRKNLCQKCSNTYMREWYARNAKHVKEYRSQPEVRKARQASVRKANQRSPEAFLRTLWHNIRKQSNYKKVKQGKLNKACIIVEITYEDILQLWEDQGGCCVISRIPMLHVFNSLKTVSLDRIDSSKGYIKTNVQLVCQFINTAKRHYSNDDIKSVLREAAQNMYSEIDPPSKRDLYGR